MRQEALKNDTQHEFAGEQKPRLLLADENPEELRRYAAMLRQLGCAVRAVGSYSSALECLDRELFDLVMVEQGGTEFQCRPVLQRALETNHRSSAIVLAGTPDVDCCLAALDNGAQEYVQKPLTESEMRDLIEEYTGSRWTPAVAGQGVFIHAGVAHDASWRKAS